MNKRAAIFQTNHDAYLKQIGDCDLKPRAEVLGLETDGDGILVPCFNEIYHVSGNGIRNREGVAPGYVTSVIVSQYLLRCPERVHDSADWVAFKDFKRTSHFLNGNIFASETEMAITKTFEGRLDALARACEGLGGFLPTGSFPYDFTMEFKALSRIRLLLLFNDKDDDFPATTTVLFQKSAEYYLDPESLGMTGAVLASLLKKLSLPPG
ncbi:MAG: DUF3786 domain-containing protein [Desulfobacterium sp.]|nr:DUF3786 domain-containing protein [Desulfobacterium sp.]